VRALDSAATILTTALLLGYTLPAQQSIGTVAMQDATVSGSISVTDGRAILVGSSSVVAKDHTAEVALNRGGMVRVCATSGLHLTQAQSAGAQPLLLALDRGAIEVRTAAIIDDIVMTPDLRFAVRSVAPLDLRLRVTKNGDTCVENKGMSAPTLGITSQFGDTSYELRPGQHVLFEHGSLKEVVDNETSPCGCPAAPSEQGMSVAEALLRPGATEGTKAVEAQHPFPADVSQGLAPPPPVPQAAAGAPHAQVATTLGFSGDGSGSISGTPAVVTLPPAAPAPAPPPAPGIGQRIGHFFKHLFTGR
jgi:hypothetical protein